MFEDLRRRRQHENPDRGNPTAAHLARTLDIDDEHEVLTAGEAPFRIRGAGPVEVAEDVSPLEELAGACHLIETLPADEIIINTVLLAGSRRARCVRAR